MRRFFKTVAATIDYDTKLRSIDEAIRQHTASVGLGQALQSRGAYKNADSFNIQYFLRNKEQWHIDVKYHLPRVALKIYTPGKFQVDLIDYRQKPLFGDKIYTKKRLLTIKETDSVEDIAAAIMAQAQKEMLPKHAAIYAGKMENLNPMNYVGGMGASKG